MSYWIIINSKNKVYLAADSESLFSVSYVDLNGYTIHLAICTNGFHATKVFNVKAKAAVPITMTDILNNYFKFLSESKMALSKDYVIHSLFKFIEQNYGDFVFNTSTSVSLYQHITATVDFGFGIQIKGISFIVGYYAPNAVAVNRRFLEKSSSPKYINAGGLQLREDCSESKKEDPITEYLVTTMKLDRAQKTCVFDDAIKIAVIDSNGIKVSAMSLEAGVCQTRTLPMTALPPAGFGFAIQSHGSPVTEQKQKPIAKPIPLREGGPLVTFLAEMCQRRR